MTFNPLEIETMLKDYVNEEDISMNTSATSWYITLIKIKSTNLRESMYRIKKFLLHIFKH